MKQKIIKIAQDLKKGTITTETARILLLGLFGVIGSLTVDDDKDILKCKNCGSVDIYGDHKYLRCGDCGETYSGSHL